MKWRRALPTLVFSLACVIGWGAGTGFPPLPPKRVKRVKPVTQGSGAQALIQPMVVSQPRTNRIAWVYPATINPSNLWWNLEASSDTRNWIVAVSNVSGEIEVNTKQPARVYRLAGRDKL